MTRAPNEPYRQFYDRMIAFLSQHLMQHKVGGDNTVDGTTVPVGGDTLSVTMMNMVAIMWLNKIHVELLSIVRTEYSKELRDNVALSHLVPRISLSIDALLAKYEKVPAVNKLTLQDGTHGQLEEHADVYRVRGGGRGYRGRQSGGRRQEPSGTGGERNFCSGCFYLGRQINAVVNYKHLPAECPRRPALVQLLEAEDADFNDDAGKPHSCLPKLNINASSQEVLSTKNFNESEMESKMSCPPFYLNDFINNKERSEALVNRLANDSQVHRSK